MNEKLAKPSRMQSMTGSIHLWGILLTSTQLTACIPQYGVKYQPHNKIEGVVSFSTPANLRLGFLRDNQEGVMYCAEPMPDVALGSEMSGSGSGAATAALSQATAANTALAQENEVLRKELQKAIERYERDAESGNASSRSVSASRTSEASASGSLNLAAAARLAVSVAELGGRTQHVLVAREFLYRLCEARANHFFEDPATYVRLQERALTMLESVYASQRQSSVAEERTATAAMLKEINTYNAQQSKLCEDKFSACEKAAIKEDDKKLCATSREKCLGAVQVLQPKDVQAAIAPPAPTGTGTPPPPK